MDVYGQALNDCFNGIQEDLLWINTSYGEPEEMPVEVFFRDQEEMPELELIAIKHCTGKVLDIGAGAGSHALMLQQKGIDVTALEISALACRIIESRGVKKVIKADIFQYTSDTYDTLLLLMNGIGLVGSLMQLDIFLEHTKKLLNPGGKIILDSSDISYLYEDKDVRKPEGYFGEVSFQYAYKDQHSSWFQWLYIHQELLKEIAEKHSYKFNLLYTDENDQYLAMLSIDY